MSRVKYEEKKFQVKTLNIIDQANDICEEYAYQGFDLTIRQLYYQFVARDILANNDRNYKRLQTIIRDGRMAGLIDWSTIVDRTREVKKPFTQADIVEAIEGPASWFQRDTWKVSGQKMRPEVWVEKQALADVVGAACREYQVPYFATRGFPSVTALYEAGARFKNHLENGLHPILYYLGDHDPSGMDIPREIENQLGVFAEEHINVVRIALNMEQVQEHNPPPNPAKETDTRAAAYIAKYGPQSWELDALEPRFIVDLIRDHLRGCITDVDSWNQVKTEDAETRNQLFEFASTFNPGARP